MAENLTFADYVLNQNAVGDIYNIGADGERDGVVEEIAVAFEYELSPSPQVDNLGDLIGKVGPAKELQQNIELVQETLGTDEDAVDIARGWVERSGLLTPVQRSYSTAETVDEPVDLAVISGGVRNWIHRRAVRLIELNAEVGVGDVLLVAGNRQMKTAEGPDVEEDMTEADYMGDIILSKLAAESIPASLVRADTGTGDAVMEEGAKAAGKLVDLESARIAVVSNAGAWVQNAGQFRRAVRRVIDPGYDREGDQLVAVSDGFQLGTGAEPTATHQNPFSATGQILRNAQELVRQHAED